MPGRNSSPCSPRKTVQNGRGTSPRRCQWRHRPWLLYKDKDKAGGAREMEKEVGWVRVGMGGDEVARAGVRGRCQEVVGIRRKELSGARRSAGLGRLSTQALAKAIQSVDVKIPVSVLTLSLCACLSLIVAARCLNTQALASRAAGARRDFAL